MIVDEFLLSNNIPRFFRSISHLFQHDLKDNMAAIGSNITVTIDLIGGTTYKIIGMMLCEN
jgi:hypothetical protein